MIWRQLGTNCCPGTCSTFEFCSSAAKVAFDHIVNEGSRQSLVGGTINRSIYKRANLKETHGFPKIKSSLGPICVHTFQHISKDKLGFTSPSRMEKHPKKMSIHQWTREQLSTRKIHVYYNLECWSKWWIKYWWTMSITLHAKKKLRSHIAMGNPWISRPHVLTQVQMRLYKRYIYILYIYMYMWLYMWLIVTLYVYDTICWVQNYV